MAATFVEENNSKQLNIKIMKSRMFIAPAVFLFALLFGSSFVIAQGVHNLSTEENLTRANANYKRLTENAIEIRSFGQSEDRSSLTLSKRYKGQSISKTGKFNVDDETKEIRFSIGGEVVAGAIVMELITPKGDSFKTLTMDDSADIRWDQTLRADRTDNKYDGDWTYKITTKNADGEYRFSISTK